MGIFDCSPSNWFTITSVPSSWSFCPSSHLVLEEIVCEILSVGIDRMIIYLDSLHSLLSLLYLGKIVVFMNFDCFDCQRWFLHLVTRCGCIYFRDNIVNARECLEVMVSCLVDF